MERVNLQVKLSSVRLHLARTASPQHGSKWQLITIIIAFVTIVILIYVHRVNQGLINNIEEV